MTNDIIELDDKLTLPIIPPEGLTVAKDGRVFRITIEDDDRPTPPWNESDGHGPVTGWTWRDPEPGERLLVEDRQYRRYYNLREAMHTAIREGWDAPPYGTGTPDEMARRAVENDFEFLQAWCHGEWWYVGIVVREQCPCCKSFTGDTLSLWGIESNVPSYHVEVARDLLTEMLAQPASGRAGDG